MVNWQAFPETLGNFRLSDKISALPYIAHKYTEHVYHFDWISDFAAARNFSISKATHDWILVLDTDEYVTSVDMEYQKNKML